MMHSPSSLEELKKTTYFGIFLPEGYTTRNARPKFGGNEEPSDAIKTKFVRVYFDKKAKDGEGEWKALLVTGGTLGRAFAKAAFWEVGASRQGCAVAMNLQELERSIEQLGKDWSPEGTIAQLQAAKNAIQAKIAPERGRRPSGGGGGSPMLRRAAGSG